MRSWLVHPLPTLLLASALALAPTPTFGEFPKTWWEFDYPADSAFWWTGSDLVTPQDLRVELRDREEHQKRFFISVQGLATEKEKAEVRGHLDGASSPELIPMWLSFRILVSGVAHRPPRTELAAQAIPYAPTPASSTEAWHGLFEVGGLEKATATLIVERARDLAVEISGASGRRAPDIIAYQQLFDELAAEVGEKNALGLFEAEDSHGISLWTGATASEVARLLTVSRTDPNIELVIAELQALKSELSPEDWQGLRRYLHTGVAPTISVFQKTSFDEEAP